jgi:membrane protein
LLVAALGAFLHVRNALCAIWKLEPPHGNTWLGIVLDYVLAIVMVFLVATLLLMSLAFSVAIPIIRRAMDDNIMNTDPYWEWVEWLGSFVFLALLFAVCYRTLSGGRIPWGYVVYGAVIASILFTIGKSLLSYYIVYTGMASMYGAAGSVVVFMIWVYYSSQILFFGAELIQARRTRHEWMDGEKPGAAVQGVPENGSSGSTEFFER